MSRVGPLGATCLLAILMVLAGGSPAMSQCDSLVVLPPHTGSQDAIHVGQTSNALWNPCAPANPNGADWVQVFDLPFACANMSCLRVSSSGSSNTYSEVLIDGGSLGFLTTNPGPDCSFVTTEFPIALTPGSHTIQIKSNYATGGPDFAFHDVRLTCAAGTPLVCPGNQQVYLPVPSTDPNLVVPILITGTTQPLEAFLMDIVFDNTSINYDSTTASNFTGPWTYFDSNALAADSVRIGGFTIPPMSPSNPDTMALMYFNIPSPLVTDPDSIWAMNFQDDFDGLPDCLGVVSYVPCGHGDVNNNGILTPADALCAWKCFLNFGVMTPDCLFPGMECERNATDVNCDGDCTTSDALWIADRAVYCGGAPLHCGGTGPPCPTPMGAALPAIAQISSIRLGPASIERGKSTRVALEVQGTGTIRSFGLDVVLPEGVEIVGMERSDATADWMGLDQGNAPGVLRMGGFSLEGAELPEGEWLTLGWVEVRAAVDAADELSFSLLDLSSELSGAQYVDGGVQVFGDVTALPSAFSLGEPRPNPSRGAVSVDFLVPAGPSRQVDIAIYNVNGQMVRQIENAQRTPGTYTVDWDGRDASGNRVAPGAYFFSMKAETFQATRKVVQMR